jgi:hypothetical protein
MPAANRAAVQAPEQQSSSADIDRTGNVAASSVGVAGQRLNREDQDSQVRPMIRINNRIANRIQSRLRTRIDRNYDPRANSTSPFAIAEDEMIAATGSRKKR